MRWRYYDSSNKQEAREHRSAVARIDAWWTEFQRRVDQIRAVFLRKSDWDLAAWMAEHLQAIDSRLCWEFGPAVRGDGHRLVITPESFHCLRPLVETILRRAPAVGSWEFYGHRLPETLDLAQMTVQARTGRDIADFKVRVTGGKNQLVDLCYALPEASAEDDPEALSAAFVATESLLGEERLDCWVGAIELIALPDKQTPASRSRGGKPEARHFLPLDRLQATVDALIGGMREQLPQRPHFERSEGAEWTMWQLEPDKEDDYCEQRDLFVGKSLNPALWTAAHSGVSFYSERFSRCNETFCYVKLDGSQGLDEEGFADKAEIEDALDAVLKPARLGCHVGGGTGLRYSYIDLALVDVEAGIRAVRERLRAGNVPKRSWVQFFDTDLAAEWVGIYPDSPAPPMQLED